MIKSYIKSTIRNMRRHKGHTAINISGLAIGIACCILILLFVHRELRYDKHHEKADQIFRVTREWFNADGETSLHLGFVAPPVGPLLATDFPELEAVVRLRGASGLARKGAGYVRENEIIFAEPAIFDLFTIPVKRGNPETALREPNVIVLTETMAEKYFADTDPLGQTMHFNLYGTEVDLRISAIIEDPPETAHFHYDFLISFATYEAAAQDLESWGSNNYGTYILTPPGYDIARLDAAMPDFIAAHHPNGREAVGRTILHFQPLTKIHLHSQLDSEWQANGSITNVYLFSAIAILILVIACINFINLTTARAARRAKEIGLRKVVGAQRRQLVAQFLGESMLFALISMVLAVGIVYLVLPAYNNFLGLRLSPADAGAGVSLGVILIIVLLVGLLSGGYPALFLSAFRPVTMLKTTRGGSRRSRLRESLVILQFSISIILLVCVGVVYTQLKFMKEKDLGYGNRNVVVIPARPAIVNQFTVFEHQLLQHPNIESVSIAKRVPSGRLLDSWGVNINYVGTDRPVDFRIAALIVDHAYLETYDIPLAAGRNFSRDLAGDSTEAFILNETAIRRIGWKRPEDAVGKPFAYGNREGFIIGVVKDFHFESLHNEIAPICLLIAPFGLSRVSVKLGSGNPRETLDFLEKKWGEFAPGAPFTHSFISERLQQQYDSEERLMEIFTCFSILAIFIACLGLLGLAAYSAQQRIKEIGIRKVLGANVRSIVIMLSREFAGFVLIANVIAYPVAYYAMNRWLETFAYQTEIEWGVFIGASLATLLIALGTISYQSIRAAVANPVDALRYE